MPDLTLEDKQNAIADQLRQEGGRATRFTGDKMEKFTTVVRLLLQESPSEAALAYTATGLLLTSFTGMNLSKKILADSVNDEALKTVLAEAGSKLSPEQSEELMANVKLKLFKAFDIVARAQAQEVGAR
jgi:hypothetical protein